MIWLSVDFDYFVRELVEWDWNHGDSAFYSGTALWYIREAQARVAGVDLRAETNPNKYAKPRPLKFFESLRDLGYNLERAPVFVADSHAFAYPAFCDTRARADRIVHFDAHHDLGYHLDQIRQHKTTGEADCGDWLFQTLHRKKKTTCTVVYPPWLGLKEWNTSWGRADPKPTAIRKFIDKTVQATVWDEAKVKAVAGDVLRIFICRSGAWVPPWYDKLFVDFVVSCLKQTKTTPIVAFKDHEKLNPLTPREYDESQLDAMVKQFRSFQS